MWNSEAQSQVPGVKIVCRKAGQMQQGLETVCCLKRHRSAIKLCVPVLLLTRFASETAEWGSVCHTWLLGMGGSYRIGINTPLWAWKPIETCSFSLHSKHTFSGKEKSTSKGGKGLWALRYLLSKCLKGTSASRAAIPVAVRAIEMPRECPQQECFITLCVLGHEAVITVNG